MFYGTGYQGEAPLTPAKIHPKSAKYVRLGTCHRELARRRQGRVAEDKFTNFMPSPTYTSGFLSPDPARMD
eukprot:g2542.t1